MTEDQKTFYSLGFLLAHNLDSFSLSRSEVKLVEKGLEDGTAGKTPAVPVEQYIPKVRALEQTRVTAGADKRKKADAAFIEKALKEPGAKKLPSGLVFIPLKPGKDGSPKATDTVKVDYEGKLTDGTIFDSSIKRGQPAEFPLNGVIPCWTEGVQLMKVGETARLICPSAIAYGDQGRPPQIPGGATLDFTVTLIEIVKK
jgi:FKBP-type peptidyl-prolyl cis-trans isomerase FkpA